MRALRPVPIAGVLYSLSPRLPFWSNLTASVIALAIFLSFVKSRQAESHDAW